MHPEITPVERVTRDEAVRAAEHSKGVFCNGEDIETMREYILSLNQPDPASFDFRKFVRKCMFAEYDGVSLKSQIDRLTAELTAAFADRVLSRPKLDARDDDEPGHGSP